MAKPKESILKNKIFGKFIAILFYALLAYGLFGAASSMNYIWKWNSVPK